jgi:hypothetical protein
MSRSRRNSDSRSRLLLPLSLALSHCARMCLFADDDDDDVRLLLLGSCPSWGSSEENFSWWWLLVVVVVLPPPKILYSPVPVPSPHHPSPVSLVKKKTPKAQEQREDETILDRISCGRQGRAGQVRGEVSPWDLGRSTSSPSRQGKGWIGFWARTQTQSTVG